ncbi:hypothetical protein FHW67_002738 [Herbaspirillum sp. Sphag1AN]|uniref:hypothetical protein n=1 Tax=unclassified Herbaspirillum TaxID=2624150 RepID=UPI00160FDC85|nr:MULTISPECIES: hypothetical protein [unclassified Herbaspirillum]MBB3213446.1 hypothetical protein [Herbaspirillum sp. Sphag1AN]MBB3246510.1 hypothetical protein [Herbaspirillum sp. Sphag64]
MTMRLAAFGLAVGYSIKTCVFGDAHSIFLVAEIRLVADNHTPVYHVVVGKVEGLEKVAFVQKKLDGADGCFSMSVADAREKHGDTYKWLPSKWPLT